MQKIKDDYAIAYKQVLAILNYIPAEDYKKIPIQKIKFYRIAAKKDYEFKYNINKTFKEQGVTKIAESILSGLFRDYWASETQRERIINRQKYERRRLEELKNEKYSVFKNKEDSKNTLENEYSTNTQLVEVKEENFFKKLIIKIKKIFYRT